MTTKHDGGAFTIEAIVSMNGREAFVLNRAPKFVYERHGNDLIATDGIFRACYRYARPWGRFEAFSGRKFSIPLADGSFEEATGQWWDAHIEGMASIGYATKAQLLACYVFTGGAMADPDELSRLRATYAGEVYPYWAYEALIKLPVERKNYWRGIQKLERDKKHLIANVKKMKLDLIAARSGDSHDD